MSNNLILDGDKIEKALNNPKNKIYFFLHVEEKYAYILLSKRVSPQIFMQELFKNSYQVSEKDFDEALEKNKNLEVVYVGDDNIMDEHFNNKP